MFVSGVHPDGRPMLPSCHGIEEPVGRFSPPRAQHGTQQAQRGTLLPTGDSDSHAERLMGLAKRNPSHVAERCGRPLLAPWSSAPRFLCPKWHVATPTREQEAL